MPGDSDRRSPSHTGGIFLLLAGCAGFALTGLQRAGASFPVLFSGPIWMLSMLVLVFAGAGLIWDSDHPRTEWRPRRKGQRFNSGVLYTREGCHLCDDARELLSRYARYLPEIVEADIDADPSLRERFNTCVPVVEFDGQVRFRGRVSEPLLQRLIEGTPPLDVR